MKIGEKVWYDEDSKKYIHQKTHDYSQELRMAEAAREMHGGVQGENRLVGMIPMDMLADWIKQAGLQWSDKEAISDLIKTKMLSGDFDKLRIWKGTY